MGARLRSLVTLAVLALVLALAAVWGWSAINEPFPPTGEAPVCVKREYAKGDKVTRADVTVSVLNAGKRVGLAGLTMDLLVDAGFAEGEEGNASRKREVAKVQVWSSDPKNPAVALVRSHLGRRVPVIRRSNGAPGVVVVVGDGFNDLVRGQRSVTVRKAATVCGPPGRAG